MDNLQENNKENGNKVFVEKDGIIHVEVRREKTTEEDILSLLEETKKTTESFPKKPKLLIVNLMKGSVLRSYRFRRKVGEKLKEIVFERAAICEESVFSRTIAMFIITAINIKNVRLFSSKERALEWLRSF